MSILFLDFFEIFLDRFLRISGHTRIGYRVSFFKRRQQTLKAIATFFMALMLTVSLVACGGGNQSGDSGNTTGDNGTVAGDSSGNTNSGSSAGEQSGRSASDSLMGDVERGMQDAGNALNDIGNTITGNGTVGNSYGDMLQNARVHDKDGNLNDGENATAGDSMRR